MKEYRANANKKRKKKLTRRQLVLTCLAVSMILGAVIGAIYMLALKETDCETLRSGLERYFKNFTGHQSGAGLEAFRESMLKYLKLTVIIWVLAYFPIGGFIAVVLIFIRGFGYGFTTAALIKSYGSGGAICALLLYLPQALILVPTYIYIAYVCVGFIQGNMNSKSNESVINYFGPLLIGCAGCTVAGAVDAFAAPMLVNKFL